MIGFQNDWIPKWLEYEMIPKWLELKSVRRRLWRWLTKLILWLRDKMISSSKTRHLPCALEISVVLMQKLLGWRFNIKLWKPKILFFSERSFLVWTLWIPGLYFISRNEAPRDLQWYEAYVGKHLTPRGGVILKGLEGFRGGTQRVALYKGGIRKFDQF